MNLEQKVLCNKQREVKKCGGKNSEKCPTIVQNKIEWKATAEEKFQAYLGAAVEHEKGDNQEEETDKHCWNVNQPKTSQQLIEFFYQSFVRLTKSNRHRC